MYVGNKIVPQVLARLGDLQVGDKNGSMAGFTYQLMNFVAREFKVGSVDYSFIPGRGLSVVVRGIQAMLTARYQVYGTHWYNPFWSEGEVFLPLGVGTEIHGIVQFGTSKAGKLWVSLESVHTQVQVVELRAERSKVQQLFKLLGKLFAGEIEKQIADGITMELQSMVDKDLSSLLMGLSPWYNIPLDPPFNPWAVDVSLCSVTVGRHHLSMDMHLEVVDPSRPWLSYQGEPPPLPAVPPPLFEARMVTLSVTPWFFNGALYMLEKGGMFNHTVLPQDLRSSHWYARVNNVTISLWPVDVSPAVDFFDNHVESLTTIKAAVKVIDPRTYVQVASASGEIPCRLGWKLHVEEKVDDKRQFLMVAPSFVSSSPIDQYWGPVPRVLVHSWVDKAISEFLVPLLDEVLERGIPLPSGAGFDLRHTQLRVTREAVVALTDFHWDPTWWLENLNGREKTKSLMRMAKRVMEKAEGESVVLSSDEADASTVAILNDEAEGKIVTIPNGEDLVGLDREHAHSE